LGFFVFKDMKMTLICAVQAKGTTVITRWQGVCCLSFSNATVYFELAVVVARGVAPGQSLPVMMSYLSPFAQDTSAGV